MQCCEGSAASQRLTEANPPQPSTPSLQSIQQLAADFLSDYVFLTVGRVGSTTEMITQHLMWVEESKKKAFLLGMLLVKNAGSALVFVNHKHEAQTLGHYLKQVTRNTTSRGVVCCAVLCCVVLCCAVARCVKFCCVVLCCVVLCCAVLCYAVARSVQLCCVVLCCVVLCCVVLCCVVLCCVVLCCVVLCCVVNSG